MSVTMGQIRDHIFSVADWVDPEVTGDRITLYLDEGKCSL